MVEFFWSFILIIFGIFIGSSLYSHVPTEYIDKPYCEVAKLGNETIKKCWKAVEVKP